MLFTYSGILWENIGSFGNMGENKQKINEGITSKMCFENSVCLSNTLTYLI